jgi:hypothetical protein
VPLPAAYPLLIAALDGLAFIGCRRKAASPSHSLVAANMRAATKQVGFGPKAAVRVFDPDVSCLQEKSGGNSGWLSARPVAAGSDGPEADHALTFDRSHGIDTL